MARLRNVQSGAVVDVPEAKVARLGSEWERIGDRMPAGESADEGYGGWKVADLKAEIAARNEGRTEENQIVPEGTTKVTLVAALEADDAATSASSQE